LAILQISLISKISLLGVKPNMILAGMPALFYWGGFWEILPAILIGGLFYDLTDFYFGSYLVPFLLTFLILWLLNKKYISSSNFLALGVLATIIFNILFLGFGYLFGKDGFFDYFLSWRHLIEIGINAILALVFGSAVAFLKNIRR
jgi:hypothetical protein